MEIYTSYFAKIGALPQSIVPISIALSAPKNLGLRELGLELKCLAPTWDILKEYKSNDNDKELYIKRFNDEILSEVDKQEILDKLTELSNGQDVALCCYESSEKFCHRNIVCEWLTGKTNEFKF